MKNKRKKCLERKKVQFPNEEVSGEMTGSLLDIIKLCRENNIRLFGVKFPLTKKYTEILEGASYHADSIFKSQGL